MKKVLLAFSAIVLSFSGAFAQGSCGFDHNHQQELKNNPEMKKVIEANESQIQNIIARRKRSKTTESVYTVPVVVHIIHKGEAVGAGSNISDAQINSGITQMNNAFRNSNGLGVDTKIQFQLATRDPNCNATTGINRIDASGVAEYSTMGMEKNTTNGAPELTIKALSRWSNSDYYNIWVITEMDDSNAGAGGGVFTAGYAYFPGASSTKDGTVILHSTFGNVGTAAGGTSGTLIHELGHALNLYHTFEGDNGGASCPPAGNQCGSGAGDCCGDTSPYKRSLINGIVSCPTGAEACTGGTYDNTPKNFMDYSNCDDRYTADQKARMRAALEGPRGSLLLSKALNSSMPTFSISAASCTPTTGATGLSGGYSGIMHVEIEGKLVSSTSNTPNDGGYLNKATSCQSAAILDLNTAYEFETEIWFNSGNVKAWIDYNNDGTFDDGTEMIYNKSGLAGNTRDSAAFTTPASATTGTYLRMRVLNDIGAVTSACMDPVHGQAEDYVVYMNAGATPAPVAAFSGNATTICTGESITFNDASTNSPTSWSWTTTGGNPASSTNQNQAVVYNTPGAYTVALTATNAGGSHTETKTGYITVTALPTISATTPATRCGTGTVSLAATASAGTVNWYAAATGGTSIGTGTSWTTPSISTTTTYYAEAINGSCTSTSRTAVLATVNAVPTVSSTTPGSNCGTGTVSLSAAASSGQIHWYLASTGGASIGTGSPWNTPSISTNTSYYAEAVDGACASSNRVEAIATIHTTPTVNATSGSRCATGTVSLSATASSGTINWYAAASGGSSLASGTSYTTPSISTSTLYYAEANDGTCSSTRGTATAVVHSLPTITGTTPGSRTGDGTVTLGATASGSSISWFTASTGGSSVGTGTSFTTPSISATTTYYVEASEVSGCVSASRTAVTATVNAPVTIPACTRTISSGSGIELANAGEVICIPENSSFNGSILVRSGAHAIICKTPFTGSVSIDPGGNLWDTPSITYTGAFSNFGTRHSDADNCATVPTTTTSAASSITCDGAVLTGEVTSDGGSAITERGFVYNTSGNPTTSDMKASTSGTTGVMNWTLTGLTNATVFYCKAYATNAKGTTYGVEVSFTTTPSPSVTSATGMSHCGTGSLVLNAVATSGTLNWYDSMTGGTLVASGSIFNTPTISATTTYYVEAMDGSCTSTDRTPVQATIMELPTITSTSSAEKCGPGSVLLSATASGGTLNWYAAQTGGTILGTGSTFTTPTISTTTTYYVEVDNSGCLSNRSAVVATINSVPMVSVNSEAVCQGNSATFTAIAPAASSYLWSGNGVGTNHQTFGTLAGDYTVVVTDLNGCTATATGILTINANPVVTLPADSAHCGGVMQTLDAGAGFNTYSWNTGASTQNVAVSSSGTYKVTVSDLNGCSSSDSTIITNSHPVVNLGTDYTSCGEGTDTLTAGSGFATYAWSTGETTMNIIAHTTGQYSVTVTDGNGCQESDTINITMSHPVVALVDDSICHGETSMLDAGSHSTYSWSTGEITQKINVNTAGLYHVTVTDGNGCSDTDSMNLTVHSPIVAVVDDTICMGETATITATAGFNTYSWGGGENTQSIMATSEGKYIVTVTDAFGCSDTDSMNLFVGHPEVSLGNDTTVCDDGGSGTLDAGAGFTSYLWNTGATSQTIEISAEGQYSVSVTDHTGCGDTDTVNINVNNPEVHLIEDSTLCGEGSITLDAGAGFSTYAWSTGETTQIISTSLSGGQYSVTVEDAIGCSDHDTTNVTISHPVVTLGSDTSYCDGGITTLDAGTGFATYAWSTGETTQTIVVSTEGTYSVEIEDVHGCGDEDTIAITINPLPLVTVNSAEICVGDNAVTFNANSSTTVAQYAWSGLGSGTIHTTTGTQAGDYTVTVTDINGCIGTGTGILTVNPSPTVTVEDVTVCDGTAGTFTASALGSAPFMYTWSGLGTGNGMTTTGTIAGDYYVSVVDNNGCLASDSAMLLINNTIAVDLGLDTGYCENTMVTLDAGNPGATYAWNTGATTQAVEVVGSDNGTKFIVTVTSGTCVGSDSITIYEYENPSSNLASDTTFCTYNQKTLDAGTGFSTYLWSTGETSSSINASGDGLYIVTITDFDGCMANDTVDVSIDNTTINLGPDTTICSGSSIDMLLNGGTGLSTYNWWWPTGTANTQTVTATETGEYHLTGLSASGCYVGDTINITEGVSPTVTVDGGFEVNYDVAGGLIPLTFGQPAGGTYSGPGVNGSEFATDIAGVGSHVITYNYTNAQGCSGSTILTLNVSPATSTVNVDGSTLAVSPNPFNNCINVYFSAGSASTSNYSLLDASGKLTVSGSLVNNNGGATINTGNLARGVYYLVISNETSTSTIKLVKSN